MHRNMNQVLLSSSLKRGWVYLSLEGPFLSQIMLWLKVLVYNQAALKSMAGHLVLGLLWFRSSPPRSKANNGWAKVIKTKWKRIRWLKRLRSEKQRQWKIAALQLENLNLKSLIIPGHLLPKQEVKMPRKTQVKSIFLTSRSSPRVTRVSRALTLRQAYSPSELQAQIKPRLEYLPGDSILNRLLYLNTGLSLMISTNMSISFRMAIFLNLSKEL